MMQTRSWQIVGGVNSFLYRLFDRLRQGLNLRLIKWLMNQMSTSSDYIVIEAGSGPGSGSSVFRKQANVRLSVALDCDIDALMEAKRRDPELSVVAADMNHLPFRRESCDVVWNSSTLEHLPYPGRALKEMSRVIKGSGFVFVGVPFSSGPLGFARWIQETSLGKWIGPPFDKESLCQLFRNEGLTPSALKIYFFNFFIGLIGKKINQPEEVDTVLGAQVFDTPYQAHTGTNG